MWIKRENELSFTASEIKALEEIPVGTWLLKLSPEKGYYLEKTPDFRMPDKVYGDSAKIADRYLNTFKNKKSNLGVLLTGMKGTGKSVTAKITCKNSNMPVILITEAFRGDSFKSFLSNITQPVVVFIDEFEKVYPDADLQAGFLSILDGIFEGKKLFLFTSNEKNRINEYMINRPGRVHYLREYSSLEDSIVEEFIDDNLINKEHKDSVMEVINILGNATMDTLTALIFEMNLYGEAGRSAIKELNLKPDRVSFDVEILNKDNIKLGSTYCLNHPLTSETLSLEVYCQDITNYKGGAHNHDSILAEMLKYYSAKKNAAKGEPVHVDDSDNNYDEETGEYIDTTNTKVEGIAELADLQFSDKMEKRQSGLYKRIDFRINVNEVQINQSKEGIEMVDKCGNKFQFKKSKPYSYTF